MSVLAVARTAAKRIPPSVRATNIKRAALCLSLLDQTSDVPVLAEFKERIAALPIDERHYWIGTFYTLLLPAKTRKEQAAYFTPPHLAEALIDLAVDAGFDPRCHSVFDPAAGGAAFLSTVVGRRLRLGVPSAKAAQGIHGFEIDAGLAQISIGLIADRVGRRIRNSLIEVRDALSALPRPNYDLVIANPPYGRITPSDLTHRRWESVAYRGHINKYAVFANLSLRAVKQGGLVALVIPSSFRAGPLYDRLRVYIRAQSEVLAVGAVAGRDGTFADVAQDISILLLRKGKPHRQERLVSFPTVPPCTEKVTRYSVLPVDTRDPWPTPMANDRHVGGASLADYGVDVRAGYFVWNRETERLVSKAARNCYPLIWGKNVKVGRLCVPTGKHDDGIDFVRFEHDSSAIIRTPAAVLQRTTNDKQTRRLIAALVDSKVIRTWGGFVTENHTIVLTSATHARLKLVVALLNTRAVDQRYRKVSGTAAISVNLLRSLDLPSFSRFDAALKLTNGDAEAAAQLAYTNTPILGSTE